MNIMKGNGRHSVFWSSKIIMCRILIKNHYVSDTPFKVMLILSIHFKESNCYITYMSENNKNISYPSSQPLARPGVMMTSSTVTIIHIQVEETMIVVWLVLAVRGPGRGGGGVGGVEQVVVQEVEGEQEEPKDSSGVDGFI